MKRTAAPFPSSQAWMVVSPPPLLPVGWQECGGAKGTINAATAGLNLLLPLPRSHLCHASACDHCQGPRGHWGGCRQKDWGDVGDGCQDGERRGADPHCSGPEVGRRAGGVGRLGEVAGGGGGREATSSGVQRP